MTSNKTGFVNDHKAMKILKKELKSFAVFFRLKTVFAVLFVFTSILSSAQEPESDLFGAARIKDHIKNKRVSSYDRSGRNNDRLTHIKDGEKATLFDVEGAGVINHIWITIAPLQPNINRNDIILRMYWDGNLYPSVESPIGPFFGQGWNESYNYASLPLAAAPGDGNALVSYFAMPFKNGARIEIENQTGKEIEAFYYYVDYFEYKQLPDDLGRFHAWYNKQVTMPSDAGENEWQISQKDGVNLDGKDNFLIADIKGRGHYIGVNYFVQSPSPMWYGEGDDMFFIDGDTLPTMNGTGTEDYFNTSWSPREIYAHPYFGYARITKDTGWIGRTHIYRFHLADPVYFQKSLRFTIEHGHANGLTLDLATVAYWYLDKASSLPPAVSKENRQPMPAIGPVEIFKWRQEWRKNNGNKPDLWGNE